MSHKFEFARIPNHLATGYRKKGYWRNETLGEMLRRIAQAAPDSIVVSDSTKHYTYSDLNEAADRLAHGFCNLGLQAGDCVVVQLPNSIKFLETIFALFRLGVIPILTLPTDRVSEIKHIFHVSSAKGYVIQDFALGCDYRKIATDVAKQIDTLEHVIVVGDANPFTSFDSLYLDPIHLPDIRPSDPALILLSGGSTALPKLIVRTHEDYIYSFSASARICELKSNSVYLCALPAGHNFTLSSPGILGVISVGGRIVMTTDPSGASVFSLIEQEKVTFTSAVPGLAIAWLHADKKHSLESLKFLQVGGAKLERDLAQRLQTFFGAKLQQVYGMSEGLVCYTRLDDDDEHTFDTQGLPISPDDEILIVDEHDHAVANDIPGELLVRGPYTIRSYLNAHEHNQRVFTKEGFYRTGDIVKQRKDGYLVVEGRLKDQVNRGGEKISAEEIEGHLLSHPLIRESAVVASPDTYLGETLCAFVVVSQNADLTAMDIKAFVRDQNVASYKIPDIVKFVSSLPKTTLGKIDKKELRKRLIETQISPA